MIPYVHTIQFDASFKFEYRIQNTAGPGVDFPELTVLNQLLLKLK